MSYLTQSLAVLNTTEFVQITSHSLPRGLAGKVNNHELRIFPLITKRKLRNANILELNRVVGPEQHCRFNYIPTVCVQRKQKNKHIAHCHRQSFNVLYVIKVCIFMKILTNVVFS